MMECSYNIIIIISKYNNHVGGCGTIMVSLLSRHTLGNKNMC